VIDAAGAIYVIGGRDNRGTYYNNVWQSTDGGARAGLRHGGGSGGTRGGTGGGVIWEILGVLRGAQWYFRDTQEYSRGKAGVLQE
jgi:hypothetical protein